MMNFFFCCLFSHFFAIFLTLCWVDVYELDSFFFVFVLMVIIRFEE